MIWKTDLRFAKVLGLVSFQAFDPIFDTFLVFLPQLVMDQQKSLYSQPLLGVWERRLTVHLEERIEH